MTPAEIQQIQYIIHETLRQLGHLNKTINKAETYRRYPRKAVDDLTKNGSLRWIQHTENGSKYIEVNHLDEVMLRNNVVSKYLKPPKNEKRRNRKNVKA